MSKLKKSLEAAFENDAVKFGESLKTVKSSGQRMGAVKARAAREEEPKKGPRNTAVSFTQEEYEFLREVFDSKARGMKVATGIKMAALYIAERLDLGLISMSRAGIIERR